MTRNCDANSPFLGAPHTPSRLPLNSELPVRQAMPPARRRHGSLEIRGRMPPGLSRVKTSNMVLGGKHICLCKPGGQRCTFTFLWANGWFESRCPVQPTGCVSAWLTTFTAGTTSKA